MPPLSVRAAIESFDEEARTVDLVFSTGAPVERMDFWTGKRYVETLSLDPAHVRLERLNAGGPLLDSHSSWTVADQLGAVEPGSVVLAKKEARATVRFSRRDAVEPVWQDVRDGIIRSVSVGYRVYTFEETQGKGNALPVRRAIDWEPFEISMVPIPADAGAKVREGKSDDSNTCQIVPAGYVARAPEPEPEDEPAAPTAPVRAAEPAAPPAKETTVENPTQRAQSFVAEPTLATPAVVPPAKAEPTEADQARQAERERMQGITQACRAARMPQAMTDKLIADGVSLVEAQRQVFEEMARRDAAGHPVAGPSGTRVEVTGEDPGMLVREGIVEALCHKAHPEREVKDRGETRKVGFALTDKGRPYMGLSLLRIAERLLISRGVQVNRIPDVEIASLALRGGGMHSSSDFPLILADVAGKTLRAGYDEAPQTFGPITRRVTVPDFKDVKRTQLGEAPALELVNEHGEIKSGTIAEGREVYAVKTYGKIFQITRKAIVNDDLDAFSRVPMLMGRQARNLESDLVWAQITSNPTMGDTLVLFVAGHGNIDSVGAAISVASIGAGRAAMRVQTGVDGVTLLNIVPRYLIVPAGLETIADQFVSQNLVAAQSANINPFAGRLQVIAEPRLDAASAIQWYLAASIAEFPDILELATLEGESGPRLEQEMGFEIEGVKFKVAYDIGAKVIDHRPLYRNNGAS